MSLLAHTLQIHNTIIETFGKRMEACTSIVVSTSWQLLTLIIDLKLSLTKFVNQIDLCDEQWLDNDAKYLSSAYV